MLTRDIWWNLMHEDDLALIGFAVLVILPVAIVLDVLLVPIRLIGFLFKWVTSR